MNDPVFQSSEDEFEAVALQTSHTISYPGDTIELVIRELTEPRAPSVAVSLVDVFGETILTGAVESGTGKLFIPADIRLGEYHLQVKKDEWVLDSVLLEVMDRDASLSVRKLLAASIEQGKAFELLRPPNVDVAGAIKLAQDATKKYVELDEAGLATQIWFDISDELRELNLFSQASEAAKQGVQLQARLGFQDKTRPRLKGDSHGAPDLQLIGFPALAITGAHDTDDALIARWKGFQTWSSQVGALYQKLQSRQSALGERSHNGQHVLQRDPLERGSAAWAIQRLAADLLPGLLADMAAFRTTGLSDSTSAALATALRSSTIFLVELPDSPKTGLPTFVAFARFADGVRDWSEIDGEDEEALSGRDRIWKRLLQLRKRLSRHITKIQWNKGASGEQISVPSAATVIYPFVEVVTSDRALVGTTVAVSRIVARAEEASDGPAFAQ
ncbi:hypothetical protein LJR034_005274 [Caballeronia sp. LjRoot34]|uniref:hypothetical protein n=1 Tax=Caballeronia sp. LjRoot34 TaxID=3342325 RepID=UPI003ECF934A